MFFKTFLFSLFLKFLWLGMILGLFKLFCNLVCKLSHRNIFIVNIVNFCFWSIFSLFFVYFCDKFYNLDFCWFGFLAMLVGINFIKITIEFFFTKLLKLLYNKIDNKSLRKNNYGKLDYNEKV